MLKHSITFSHVKDCRDFTFFIENTVVTYLEYLYMNLFSGQSLQMHF